MATIPVQYILPVEVASYDVGADNRLKLSAVLRYQQEAGERHLTAAGLGWSDLLASGMAFVTSRWHCRITRLPAMGERVVLTTWHRERKGARFLRCYEWRDEQGAVLLCGVMQFALVSADGHRLLRGDEFDKQNALPSHPETVDCADPTRYKLPDLATMREYRVAWSDTDRNGHTNNTRYADFTCDAIADGLDTHRITDVQMHFAGETRRGDTLHLATASTDAVYVAGTTLRGTVFSARVEWTEL